MKKNGFFSVAAAVIFGAVLSASVMAQSLNTTTTNQSNQSLNVKLTIPPPGYATFTLPPFGNHNQAIVEPSSGTATLNGYVLSTTGHSGLGFCSKTYNVSQSSGAFITVSSTGTTTSCTISIF